MARLDWADSGMVYSIGREGLARRVSGCRDFDQHGLAMATVHPYRSPQRALRLSVRTAAFHVAETGSTPVGRANTFQVFSTLTSLATPIAQAHVVLQKAQSAFCGH